MASMPSTPHHPHTPGFLSLCEVAGNSGPQSLALSGARAGACRSGRKTLGGFGMAATLLAWRQDGEQGVATAGSSERKIHTETPAWTTGPAPSSSQDDHGMDMQVPGIEPRFDRGKRGAGRGD